MTMSNKKEISFEQALEELQGVVERLEAGKVALEDSLSLYERGMELVKICNQALDRAEQRVSLVRPDAQGEAQTEPFEAEVRQ